MRGGRADWIDSSLLALGGGGLKPYLGTQRRVLFVLPLTSQAALPTPYPHTPSSFYFALPACLAVPGCNLESVSRAGVSTDCTIPVWVGPPSLLSSSSPISLAWKLQLFLVHSLALPSTHFFFPTMCSGVWGWEGAASFLPRIVLNSATLGASSSQLPGWF